VKIQKMQCTYLCLDHKENKVMMECMPQANEVFSKIIQMKPKENEETARGNNIEMLTLNKCGFQSESLVPLKLTYLNLRFVEGIKFVDLLGPTGVLKSMESLQTLLYEGERCTEELDLQDCCELLRNLQVLSICGVCLKSLTQLNCKRLMLRGNKYYGDFDQEYPELLKNVRELVIVGNAVYSPTFMTLTSFLDYVKQFETNTMAITLVRFLLENDRKR